MTTELNQLMAFGLAPSLADVIANNRGGVNPVNNLATTTTFNSMGVPILTTAGTGIASATAAVGTFYEAELFIPVNTTITGLAILNGATISGNVSAAIYDTAGNLLANTAVVAQAGASAYQSIPLTTPLSVNGPARFFVVFTFSSATATFYAFTAGFQKSGTLAGQTIGTWTMLPSVPTAFTANVAPVAVTY